MKKTAIILVLLVGSTILLSARDNGNKNDNDKNDRRDQRSEHMDLDDAEIITITGKLVLENDEMPTITTGGVTYTVMGSWFELEDLELTNGMTVTLKGAEITRRLNWDGKEKRLILTEITINGKTTEIDHTEGQMGRGGRMGNRDNNDNNRGNSKGNGRN